MRKSSRYLSICTILLLIAQIGISITILIDTSIEVPDVAQRFWFIPLLTLAWMCVSLLGAMSHLRKKAWRVAPRVYVSSMAAWIAFFSIYAIVMLTIATNCKTCPCDWSYLQDPLMVVLNVVVVLEMCLFCVLDVQRGGDTLLLLEKLYGVEEVSMTAKDAHAASLIHTASKEPYED